MVEPTRGEKITGLVWLSVGALVSLLLEVVYLLDFPLMIVIAALFNAVLTRTARLWSPQVWVGLIPLMVWVVGFGAVVIIPSNIQALGNNILSLLLLFAGIAGGGWPFVARK
ncbi:hypothetical protein G7Y31_04275 [Corynebacterium lizhenjunii]|uniref:Uncharacterized protein n=1 Tax=Corynebacterium lizhenjunii TaxID=2709394 RepID=A0A7T0KGD2_9CORY|nr:hypothetical protein [Corynebacterium lizhenjunii]QPK79916.1 hypothetical protein G7Y31_04275 [Corynebacterium lizhenjunii]